MGSKMDYYCLITVQETADQLSKLSYVISDLIKCLTWSQTFWLVVYFFSETFHPNPYTLEVVSWPNIAWMRKSSSLHTDSPSDSGNVLDFVWCYIRRMNILISSPARIVFVWDADWVAIWTINVSASPSALITTDFQFLY